MNKPRVLLTGVSGFIAKHCAMELLDAGYSVRGTLRSLERSGEVRDSLAKHTDVSRLEFVEADLESDTGWRAAARGCEAVLHVASPFPTNQPKDEQVLIRPAVEGTLRVLRAATAAGARRFVQTSSMVAVMYGHPKTRTEPYRESDWTNTDAPGVTAYAKSKTLAEHAAREYMGTDQSGMHYSSVNPGFVLGPALDRDVGTSAEVIQMFLRGKYPGAPRLSMPVVDVRDIARMHRLALETNAPSGGRYLGVSEVMWMIDIARAIRADLGSAANKVPTRELPDLVLKIVAVFDPTVRQIVPDLGHEIEVDNTWTRETLDMRFIPGDDAAAAMARSLLNLGIA